MERLAGLFVNNPAGIFLMAGLFFLPCIFSCGIRKPFRIQKHYFGPQRPGSSGRSGNL